MRRTGIEVQQAGVRWGPVPLWETELPGTCKAFIHAMSRCSRELRARVGARTGRMSELLQNSVSWGPQDTVQFPQAEVESLCLSSLLCAHRSRGPADSREAEGLVLDTRGQIDLPSAGELFLCHPGQLQPLGSASASSGGTRGTYPEPGFPSSGLCSCDWEP